MIDLHTHTIFSDGELIPAELIQRAEVMGLEAIALTDHVDQSNLDLVLPRVLAAVAELNRAHSITALAGVEITHVPPSQIASLAARARDLGAAVVVVHGETLVEPVAEGTNQAALDARVDLLAHPGLLTLEQAALAAQRGVLLELSARKGHCLGNGRVARLAAAAGANLVVNTDAHAPGDLIGHEQARRVALGAGLEPEAVDALFENAGRLVARATGVQV